MPDGVKPVASPATGRQIARGAAWMMLFKLADRSVGLVSTLILARLLTPADFGLVAMATAVVALTELMGAFGFDTALIQRQDAQRAHYDTAWSFNVLFGITIATLLLLLAEPAATFYRDPRLADIIPVLAAGALISGFENIGTVAFRKELDFKSEFRFLFAKRISGFIVTLGVAFVLRSYWALIAGIVTGKAVSVLISYRLHPYRPRFDLSARADLLHFSKWLMISNIIQFLHSRSTDFILGRTIGSHGLGIYNVAAEIAALPATELIAPLNRAVYPAYSRLSTQLDQLLERFVSVFGVIAIVALPVSFGMVAVAEPAVRTLLGPQWLEAVPIIRIVALSGLAGALQSNLYLIILALGRPKANTLLSASLLAFSLPAVVVASLHYGAVGAAVAHCASSAIGLIAIVIVFSRHTGMRVRKMLLIVIRPMVAAIIMLTIIIIIDNWLMNSFKIVSELIRLLILVLLGSLSYIGIILSLWLMAGKSYGTETMLINLILNKFNFLLNKIETKS